MLESSVRTSRKAKERAGCFENFTTHLAVYWPRDFGEEQPMPCHSARPRRTRIRDRAYPRAEKSAGDDAKSPLQVNATANSITVVDFGIMVAQLAFSPPIAQATADDIID